MDPEVDAREEPMLDGEEVGGEGQEEEAPETGRKSKEGRNGDLRRFLDPEFEGDEGGPEDGEEGDGEEAPGASAKKRRSRSSKAGPSGDLRNYFAAAAAAAAVSGGGAQAKPAPFVPPAGADGHKGSEGMMGAFSLTASAFQEVPTEHLQPPPVVEDGQLVTTCIARPTAMSEIGEPVTLLVASAPLLPSGRAIFAQLPNKWIDLSGRSDALGTRCLFAARRHEHSVFEPLGEDRLLRVPHAAAEWQPAFVLPSNPAQSCISLSAEEPWAIQAHPRRREVRLLVRPGVLLARMMRRGTALPSARFTWRVTDSDERREEAAVAPPNRSLASDVGEFSILSNIEDAAYTQPPRFEEFPLRVEQLRSLGWMVSQERRRKDPFVTELRETAACPDAMHWQLEGRLSCEYLDVKGGVLADAIGYGKTACTIGLVDCTCGEPTPQVPPAYFGFIPSRATLILAPTNLHAQWLAEIQKFTGKHLKVLSVPTCAQLKKLQPKDIMEADVVVATYRLFYSTPYLQRLQELARTRRPDFAFPRLPAVSKPTKEWAKAYREAFELLPGWAANLQGLKEPVTPAKLSKGAGKRANLADTTPDTQSSQGVTRRVLRGKQRASEELDTLYSQQAATADAPPEKKKGRKSAAAAAPAAPAAPEKGGKRRRLDAAGRAAAGSAPEEFLSAASAEWATTPQYIPLEAFWWKRVVCDEFHELLSRYPPAQVAVELFHATFKWGLSGTPPCQNLAQIRKAAGFFGVQIPAAAPTDDSAEMPRKVAQEWLDAFVRRNTVELPELQEEERIIPVHLKPKERALYAALTQQHQHHHVASTQPAIADGVEEPPEIQAARRSASGLLKLCSHFCPSGATDVLTADQECERQLALRREQARTVERDLRGHVERAVQKVQLVRHFEPHYCCTPWKDGDTGAYGYIDAEPRAAVAARLKFLGAATTGTKQQLVARLFEGLSSPEVSEAVKEMALRVDFDPKKAGSASKLSKDAPAWAALEAAAAAAGTPKGGATVGRQLLAKAYREAWAQREGEAASAGRCARLRANLGMPRWPGSVNREALNHGPKVRELEAANWAWLAEPENAKALREAVDAWKASIQKCAAMALELEAAATLRLQSLQSFSETLASSQAALPDPAAAGGEALAEAASSAPDFAKYGSKIEALVTHVLKLQARDPGCKMICFVQWEDLKRKISAALQEFGVKHLTLQGSVWARRAALVQFQYEEESPKMLLLSLEESASGTNLTAANHVFIVHPMEAATRDEAVAFEMQAVGRVRRPGQQRKIHVWRFVTVDTIEQEITEEHQRELWNRQQAALELSRIATQASQQFDQNQPVEHEEPEDEADVAASSFLEGGDCSTQRYLRPELDDVVPPPPLPPPRLPPVPPFSSSTASAAPRRAAPAAAAPEPPAAGPGADDEHVEEEGEEEEAEADPEVGAEDGEEGAGEGANSMEVDTLSYGEMHNLATQPFAGQAVLDCADSETLPGVWEDNVGMVADEAGTQRYPSRV